MRLRFGVNEIAMPTKKREKLTIRFLNFDDLSFAQGLSTGFDGGADLVIVIVVPR